MKFKHPLIKYRLVAVNTGKVIKQNVLLTRWEANAFNYAFTLNRTGKQYQKI